jgi:hypothetical protein
MREAKAKAEVTGEVEAEAKEERRRGPDNSEFREQIPECRTAGQRGEPQVPSITRLFHNPALRATSHG